MKIARADCTYSQRRFQDAMTSAVAFAASSSRAGAPMVGASRELHALAGLALLGLALGRQVADRWDLEADNAAGERCRAFGAGGIMRQPTRLAIAWSGDDALEVKTDAGEQTRVFGAGPGIEASSRIRRTVRRGRRSRIGERVHRDALSRRRRSRQMIQPGREPIPNREQAVPTGHALRERRSPRLSSSRRPSGAKSHPSRGWPGRTARRDDALRARRPNTRLR